MTRSQLQKLATLIIAVLLALTVFLLGGCGPAYHLQRAKHHTQRAIDKGADIKKDTILFHFRSPEIKFSTTIRPEWLDGAPVPLWRDTLTAKDEKTGATTKAKISLKPGCPEDCIDTLYLETIVPPQDGTAEVPCETVQAGYTVWQLVGTCIAVGTVCILIGMFIQGRRR